MGSIAYTINNSLYLNITNRCTNECTFCIRNKTNNFNLQFPLWLEHEPTAPELLEAIGDPNRYQQIVFCGYGEPLIRLDAVKEVAQAIKKQSSVPIRIDTNGQGNLYWGRNILPELAGLIDFLSISLNADNPAHYDQLCRSFFGKKAYNGVIEFARLAKAQIPKVELSIVDLPGINQESCRQIAEKLGVGFRLRPYYEEKYVR